MDILSQIVSRTRDILETRKRELPLADLEAAARARQRPHHALTAALAASTDPLVIAEFKRKSPSRPNINMEADPVAVAKAYAAGGAAAMSILTEPDFFAGSPDDLRKVADAVSIPLLRKDFVIDRYQLHEAKAWGADLVLLIARILEPSQLAELQAEARELGLETLCEIHNLDEYERVGDTPIDFLGVNCRDLKRFATNLDQLIDIVPHLPKATPWVAESGIHAPEDVARLHEVGYRAYLVGEYLMKSPDPSARLEELRTANRSSTSETAPPS
ncbi:indole-3-glycerol phosphate synthase TrpC [Sulfidibacter corallicola]|uniref:Indole-3-glycerol phosphate synthase n=1 Tax=Sulfidibacter corallicola TaxID=2818388 RepID=A0A8A4TWF7_SULCO|nr:indole-3-glycerol phosphate synthase TrpC [Sulfidibacter corallicola]QTD53823.1 indole-3-glycerol phosphate synthase TrpC [Sulfidibacter corallicola]